MALSGSIKVEGLAPLQKQLKALGADKAELIALNVEAAETLANAFKPDIPQYRGTQGAGTSTRYLYKSPGSLAKSLRIAKTQAGAQVTLGNARVVYANPIHWGWFEDANFVEKNIKPNPFILRASHRKYSSIIAKYDAGLDRLIAKYGLEK